MIDKRDKMKLPVDVTISDKDVYDAMKDIPGYLDITPGDFKDLYRHAYQHALSRITRSVKAKDIMTEKVITADKEDSLKKVAELMARHGISGIPVIKKDRKVAGVISEKDFLSRMGAENRNTFMGIVAACLKGKGCVALPVRGQKAKDMMTTPAVTVGEDATVEEIARIFTDRNINRVPVVDSENRLIGIVSRADIVRASLPNECP